MGNFYHVNAERELVLFHSTGRFTGGDFIDLLRAAHDTPQHKPDFSHIWDTRAIDELVVDTEVISMYRDLLSEYGGKISRGKIAVVTVRALTRTVSTMVMELRTEHPAIYRFFDDLEGAAEWIGVPVSAVTDIPEREWREA